MKKGKTVNEHTDSNVVSGPNHEPKKIKVSKQTLKDPKSIVFLCSMFALVGVTFLTISRAAPPEEFRGMRGEAAIEHLDRRLNQVAKDHGMTGEELKNLLLKDPTLEVTENDLLAYIEPELAPEETTAADTVAEAISTAPYSLEQTFKLHSNPSGTKKIFLDFDGHTTSGTSWNSSYSGGAPIVSAPMDNDGSPTTFSATEQEKIQYIWARVVEDYSIYDVDVTTEDPGVEALKKTSSTDEAYGIRAVISPTNFYSASAGGVAYVGSFNYGTDTPCFVFMANSSHKTIGEAVSHEVGHTLGLRHDGYNSDAYYYGQGSWAPIMGVGYYDPITQWSKGEYTGATNLEDDLTVMLSYGIKLYGDDVGDTIQTAKAMSGDTTSSSATGLITSRTDKDIFSFDSGSHVTLRAIPSALIEPNLDIKIRLLRSDGSVIAESDQPGVAVPTIDTTVTPGKYYVGVDGVGYLDPATTGYSDYASVGNYQVVYSSTGSAPIAKITATPQNCVVATPSCAIALSSSGSIDPDGGSLTYQWDFGDKSNLSSATNVTHTYTQYGSFTVSLTVKDSQGFTGSATKVVTVTQGSTTPPIAVAQATPTTGTAPLAVQFSSSGSKDPSGGTISYSWNFGDGSAVDTSANPAHTYNSAGTFTSVLTVATTSGASIGLTSTSSVVIAVGASVPINNPPIAVISATPQTGNAPLDVVFSSAGSTDPEGSTLTYKWNFGDGTSEVVGQSATHTYSVAGTYTAKLTVSDPQGASATKSLVITVNTPPLPPTTKTFSIQSVSVSKGTSGKNKYALAQFVLVDQDGKPLSGATVTGSWSGLIVGTGSAISDINGSGSIRSKNVKKTGTVTFTVTSIVAPTGGSVTYKWDGVIKSASISL